MLFDRGSRGGRETGEFNNKGRLDLDLSTDTSTTSLAAGREANRAHFGRRLIARRRHRRRVEAHSVVVVLAKYTAQNNRDGQKSVQCNWSQY